MKPNARLIAVLPLVAVFAIACGKKDGGDKEKDKGKKPDTPVTVTQPAVKSLDVVEQVLGTVAAEDSPIVAAEVPGRVVAVYGSEGDAVKAGQLLVRLEDQDARAQLDVARAEERRVMELIRQQQRTIERLEGLGKDYATRAQLDDTQSQKAALQEQLASARAQLTLAQRNLEKTQVRAPANGRIQARNVSVGDRINPDKALFTVVGLGARRVHLPFPEHSASLVRAGQRVQLRSPMDPAAVVDVKIVEVKPRVDASTRALDAIANLPASVNWLPGASVDARIVTGHHPDAMVVPETAVVLRPKGTVVYVLKDKVAQERLVQTGLRQEGVVEIRSGVAAGETIAVDGAAYLSDGAKVAIKGASQAETAK